MVMQFSSVLSTGCQILCRFRKALMVVPLVLSLLCIAGINVVIAGGHDADAEKNKKIVMQWIEEVVKKGNLDHHDANAHDDIKINLAHNWESPVNASNKLQGKDEVKKHFQAAQANWEKKAEDTGLEIDEIIAEGNTVAVRGHRFFKDLKTNTKVKLTGMGFYKIKDGKVAEIHVVYEAYPTAKN